MIGFFVLLFVFSVTGADDPITSSVILNLITVFIGVVMLRMVTKPQRFVAEGAKPTRPVSFIARLGYWTRSFFVFGFLTLVYMGFRVIFPKKPKSPRTA